MILQDGLPYDPLSRRKLPGVAPLDPAEWLLADEAYGAQMALRRHMLDTQRDLVLALDPGALPAAQELLQHVLDSLPAGFQAGPDAILCPDGTRVPCDRLDPLSTAGRLVQEDLCLMMPRGAEHVLTGAVLCFPSNWTLAEKFLRPLIRIHKTVPPYDADIARRVQRLFDGVRAGRPLWRYNAHWHNDPTLFHPRLEADQIPFPDPESAPYLRSERQCILRLAQTGAVVFSIHTYIVTRAALSAGRVAGQTPAGRY